MSKIARDILFASQQKIKAGWIQEVLETVNAEGIVCYCIIGAVNKATNEFVDQAREDDKTTYEIKQTIYEASHSVRLYLRNTLVLKGLKETLTEYNDDTTRTQDDVIALFDATLARLDAAAREEE
jgi:light-regulated signal transduction histidine kinase (bacteriophytochrome)